MSRADNGTVTPSAAGETEPYSKKPAASTKPRLLICQLAPSITDLFIMRDEHATLDFRNVNVIAHRYKTPDDKSSTGQVDN
mgnify:CR=1